MGFGGRKDCSIFELLVKGKAKWRILLRDEQLDPLTFMNSVPKKKYFARLLRSFLQDIDCKRVGLIYFPRQTKAFVFGINPTFLIRAGEVMLRRFAVGHVPQEDEAVVAAEVWDDFVKVHWPTIYEQKQVYTATYPSTDEYTEEELSSWEEPDCEDDLIALCIHA